MDRKEEWLQGTRNRRRTIVATFRMRSIEKIGSEDRKGRKGEGRKEGKKERKKERKEREYHLILSLP